MGFDLGQVEIMVGVMKLASMARKGNQDSKVEKIQRWISKVEWKKDSRAVFILSFQAPESYLSYSLHSHRIEMK